MMEYESSRMGRIESDLGIGIPFSKGQDIIIRNCWHFSTDGNAVDILFRTEWNGVEVKEPGGWFLNYPDFYDGLADVACTDERGVCHIRFEDCQCAGGSREDGVRLVVVEDAVVCDVEFAFRQTAE